MHQTLNTAGAPSLMHYDARRDCGKILPFPRPLQADHRKTVRLQPYKNPRGRRSPPSSDPVWQNGRDPQPNRPYSAGGWICCTLRRCIPRTCKSQVIRSFDRQQRYGRRPLAHWSGAQGEAHRLRNVRGSATGDNTICTRRRFWYMGPRALRHRDHIHRRCTEGPPLTPPRGVEGPARPQPSGAAKQSPTKPYSSSRQPWCWPMNIGKIARN